MKMLLLDLMVVFHRKLQRSLSHACFEYRDVLVDLGKVWGLHSRSLDAFLHDVWVKPICNGYRYPGTIGSGSIRTRICAMGFSSGASDPKIFLRNEEILPFSMKAERGLKPWVPNEWTPTQDYWWYEVDGTTYEIHGLMNSNSLDDENSTPTCYGRIKRDTSALEKTDTSTFLRGYLSFISNPMILAAYMTMLLSWDWVDTSICTLE